MEETRDPLPKLLSESEEAKYPKASYFYKYLHSLEIEDKRRPLPNYMETIQQELKPYMRTILIDWIVEVCQERNLNSDTLYLAVSYIDRYLSAHSVPKKRFQLLGITSVLIASKYENMWSIDVRVLCHLTENSSTIDEVFELEKDVRKVLDNMIGPPTILTFLRILTPIVQENRENDKKSLLDWQLEFLGRYLGELSLLDYCCVRFLPSIVAASAIFLSRFILRPDEPPWNVKLHEASGYSASQLKDCVGLIHQLHSGTRIKPSNAVREKYALEQFRNVPSLISLPQIPERYFDN